ncbi:NAD(P)-dependent oxidoreductase [Actinosynnema sp. CS-041913]|uniref:NAD(P)-dependent oxidoreductase n=1 Tax=Actinosynnema sp. CS-041913 TaxID=3239917 RepID=UPI003D938F1D
MRITVFGAAGGVGSRVVAEAGQRGHEVTAVSRGPRPGFEVGDASVAADVARLATGRDLVVGATRPAPGRERELAVTAKALLDGLRGTTTRLILVGGAGSLITPNGVLVHDEPDFPPDLRPIALACTEQLDVVRAESEVDWTYLSPPAVLEPGERTGGYRLGRDDLIVDAEGKSAISLEDFAVALLDEAALPRHRRTRFTVGY